MAQAPALDPVETPKVPVSNTYHGVTVTEDYRWLEDAGADQTRSWTMAQDQRTRSYLENLPGYGAVRRRVEEVLKSESVRYDADRKSTRLNSSHLGISYAVFCLKK